MDPFVQILITIVGSGAVFSFLQFLITRKDNKEQNGIDKQLSNFKDEFVDLINNAVLEKEREYKEEIKEQARSSKLYYESTNRAFQQMATDYKEDREHMIVAIKNLRKDEDEINENIRQLIRNQDNMAKVIIGLSQEKLIERTTHIINRGMITVKEKAAVQSICIPYVNMGGNSHAKSSCEEIETLPVVSEQVAKEMDRAQTEDEFREMLDHYLTGHENTKVKIQKLKKAASINNSNIKEDEK